MESKILKAIRAAKENRLDDRQRKVIGNTERFFGMLRQGNFEAAESMIKTACIQQRRRQMSQLIKQPGEDKGALVHDLSFLGLVVTLFAETAD